MPGVEVYWLLAIISSIILGVIVLLNVFGFDVDDFDADFGGDAFSINSLIAFVCVGSWTGYVGHHTTTVDGIPLLLIALASGLVTYVGSIWILKKMRKWETSGNLELDNAIGTTGSVYLSIPEKRSGKGQIQAIVQGRLATLTAMTNGDKLTTGEKIIIYDVEKNIVLVESYTEN